LLDASHPRFPHDNPDSRSLFDGSGFKRRRLYSAAGFKEYGLERRALKVGGAYYEAAAEVEGRRRARLHILAA
jgi:hypothetical protein